MTQIGGIILAAGESRRFGGRKQLAEISGKSLLRHAIDAVGGACTDRPFVVLGAYHNEIAPHIADVAMVIVNLEWSQGMGTSIVAGIHAIKNHTTEFDGAMIAVCDQICLKEADYRKLVAAFDGSSIVATAYPDGLGVPAIFPRSMWDDLAKLDGATGAKKLVNHSGRKVTAVALPNATIDIDTRQNLVSVMSEF
ncbi:nucleotidyltransferase family protein [Thalassospira profundimaris]|uniref:nucleotidyltransferase family protein n=1 Tax=Thalassospira profundimaris TaxID=502049 RepID=UPI000DED77AD|nr:nucleotidyltransferase family protein [Thalassospira profundimaris]